MARSLTLLRVFLVASAVILVGGAVALGGMLTSHDRPAGGRRRASGDRAVRRLRRHAGSRPRRTACKSRAAAASTLERGMQVRGDLFSSLKVWRKDGLLLWTTLDRSRNNRYFPISDDLGETLETGEAHGAVENLDEAPPGAEDDGRAPDRGPPRARGLRADPRVPTDGFSARTRSTDAPSTSTRSRRANVRTIWLTVAGVFAALLLLLTAARQRRLPAAAPPDGRPAPLVPDARANRELARDDRDPQRDRRGEGPVHGRPLAACPPHRRSRSVGSSGSRVSASTRSRYAARSSTTSARSASRTRS